MFALAAIGAAQQLPTVYRLQIVVTDGSGQPITGAQVDIKNTSNEIKTELTDLAGSAAFPSLTGGEYSISVSKRDFDVPAPVTVTLPGASSKVAVTLQPKRHKENVEVTATADPLDSAASGTAVRTSAARELPTRPSTVADVLPLTPGISRTPEGTLTIDGGGEQRSALIVNSADVTDPATGQFGTTVPIDSVQSLNVLQTPFLAEYGRFTSALVSVETRRGGDKWKAELNDPFPDFRIRSYHLRGIRDATPRLNFEGPLVKDKLFFSEGFEYEIQKTPVITLPFPENQKTKQGLNSFSQLDYVLSASHLITGTFHLAPTQLESVNLDTFNPKSTVPDASLHDETATLGDHLTLFKGDLFENTLSYTNFTAGVWPHGVQDLSITPSGNLGNYFAQQRRRSSRLGLSSTYSLRPIDFLGSHNLKFGSYFAGSTEEGDIAERPFNILDSTGLLLERISFTGGSPVRRSDTEIAWFAQDHWLLTPQLALDAGLRLESQEVTESFRLAPRIGLAWTPSSHWGTVIRAARAYSMIAFRWMYTALRSIRTKWLLTMVQTGKLPGAHHLRERAWGGVLKEPVCLSRKSGR